MAQTQIQKQNDTIGHMHSHTDTSTGIYKPGYNIIINTSICIR